MPAALKLVTANAVPLFVNHYLRKKDFARVSWQTIGANLQLSSWEWDSDNFFTNQFSHPYHGSLYFNAFRSEGYGFWQPALAVVGGSLLWEITGEKDRPAINDLVNTSLGGMAFGEMTHRLSRKFTAKRVGGGPKKLLHLTAFIINPQDGISNLVNPVRRKKALEHTDSTPLRTAISVGGRSYHSQQFLQKTEGNREWFSRFSLVYGDKHLPDKTPFSHFSFLFEVGQSDSAFFNLAQVEGRLRTWPVVNVPKRASLLTLTINYDYYNNSAFSYGMQSLRANFLADRQWSKDLQVQAELGLGPVGLAAISGHDLFVAGKRNYDYATGLATTVSAKAALWQRLLVSAGYQQAWLKTLDGVQPGYRITSGDVALLYQFHRYLFLSYDFGHFLLQADGKNETTVSRHNNYNRLSLGYRFVF